MSNEKERKKNKALFNKANKWAKKHGHDLEDLATNGMGLKSTGFSVYKYGVSSNSGFRLLAHLFDKEKENEKD